MRMGRIAYAQNEAGLFNKPLLIEKIRLNYWLVLQLEPC